MVVGVRASGAQSRQSIQFKFGDKCDTAKVLSFFEYAAGRAASPIQ